MHKLNTETGADYVALEISEDDFQSYTVLAEWGSAEGVFDWKTEDIDISAWNNKLVKFRWSAKGDYSVTGDGWWIDNIDIGGLFQDDGGEDFTTALWGYGITGAAAGTGMSGDHFVMDSPIADWEQASVTYPIFPLEINGVNSNFGPDDKVRLAINWATDGDAADEAPQLAIDNVVVYALARFDVDLAISGANVLSAKQGVNFTPTVYFTNIGLTSIETNFEWTGQLKNESGELVHSFSRNSAGDLAVDSSMVLVADNLWLPEEAGRYQLTISAPIPGDGDLDNNELNIEVWVPGGPWTAVLWREDFDSNPTANSFEDFGFSIINNGGDAAGANTNTWEISDDFLYGSGALISSFWGHLNEGENTTDKSEELDEGLVTPAINISSLSSNNTLHLRGSIYFRSGHPLFSIYGEATSQFSISASLDGSAWVDIFDWIDDDGLPGDGPRLPNHFYPDTTIDFRELLDFDLTPVLRNRQAGQNELYLKFNLKCENSWFVGMSVDELMVYAGVSAPVITDLSDTPNDDGNQLNLTWRTYQPVLTIWDNAGTGWPVTDYEISRQDDSGRTVLNTVPAVANQSVYKDVVSTLQDNLATTIMVTAKTENPLLFQESEPASAASLDNVLPEPAQNLTAAVAQNTVALNWEPSPSADVIRYRILRNNVLVDSSRTTTFTEKIGPGEYNYAVVAITGSGQQSDPAVKSTAVEAGVFLTSVTDVPNDEGLLVAVNWDIFEPNMVITDTLNNQYPITAFDIQRRDDSNWITQETIAITADSTQFTAEIATLADSLETAFKIIAKTADTGKQLASAVQTGISADNTDPAAPANLAAIVTGPLVQLSWDPSASSDIVGYLVFRDALPVDTTTAVTFAENLSSGDYEYFIRTIDDAGRLSKPSNSVTASVVIEINLAINSIDDVADDEGLQVMVSWSALAGQIELPDVDRNFWPVVTFEILRMDDNGWNTVGSIAADTSNTQYALPVPTKADGLETSFQVCACTENPDVYLTSEPASGTSTDDRVPLAPTNLTTSVAGNTVTVQWTKSASPDVVEYRVYRDGAAIASVSELLFSETLLDG
ncbi:hypothetical protein KAH55_06015, partial [bacterium]|nr:hypothetical protein [bacterium]